MSRFAFTIDIRIVGLALLAWLGFWQTTAYGQGLADHIDGFPVMSGLRENADAFVMFDKAEGRIIAGVLQGRVQSDAAKAYYGESLIQLGWRMSAQDDGENTQAFLREEERLVLRYEREAGLLTIHIHLQPGGR